MITMTINSGGSTGGARGARAPPTESVPPPPVAPPNFSPKYYEIWYHLILIFSKVLLTCLSMMHDEIRCYFIRGVFTDTTYLLPYRVLIIFLSYKLLPAITDSLSASILSTG